jgi:hypothetical protein
LGFWISQVTFQNNPSTFVQSLSIRSTGHVNINTNVTAAWKYGPRIAAFDSWTSTTLDYGASGSVVVVADSLCTRLGNFTIGPYSGLTSSNTPIWMRMHDYIADGFINAGTSSLMLTTCTNGRTMDIGGNGLNKGDQRYSQTELSRLYATNVTFQVLGVGLLNIYNVVPANWQGISKLITFDITGTQGAITFWQTTTWRWLTALASNGITIWNNVTTLGGDLLLEGNSDNLHNPATPFDIQIASGNWLIVTFANANLILGPNTANNITATAPVNWNSTGNIIVMSPVWVFNGTGNVILNADSDSEGTGTLFYGPMAWLNVSIPVGYNVSFFAATYDFQTTVGINAGVAPLTVQVP